MEVEIKSEQSKKSHKSAVKTYARYKDSGVEWLGEIPEHWEIRKLKSFLTVHGRIGFRGYTVNDLVGKGEGAITISPSNMGESEMIWEKVSYLSWRKYFESPEIMVNNGDLLIVKTASIGKVAYVKNLKGKATINPQVLLLKNIRIDRDYFYYQLLSSVIQQQLETEKIGSTIYTISENKVLNFNAIIPPLPEQTAIAQFLDDKTNKIDQAIAIKEQQIALLKERKQILIHKAVTRGLNDRVALKDSGVEWIGEIPVHWEVKRLRYIGKTQNGLSKGGEYFGSGYPFLTYGDVYKDTIVPNKLSGLAESTLEDQNQFSVKSGDIFFTRTSETVEEIGFSSTCLETVENATFAGFLIRFRPHENVLYKGFSRFYFSSRTHRSFFVGQMNLVIRASLSQELLKAMPVLIPPLEEQEQISTYIETAANKIETTIGFKQQEIEKLKEYKSSLINSVVTGKVKVC